MKYIKLNLMFEVNSGLLLNSMISLYDIPPHYMQALLLITALAIGWYCNSISARSYTTLTCCMKVTISSMTINMES